MPNGEVLDSDYALLSKENILPISKCEINSKIKIVISKDEVSITNGKIKAKLVEDGWRKRAVIHY